MIIIPARYQSSRFPGKPLVLLHGKPSILWTLEAANRVDGVDGVYVATDDERIAQTVADHGGQVLMTSSACRNGTERVAEAAAMLDDRPAIVVNVQGDAPLTPNWYVSELITALRAGQDADLATPILRCAPTHYDGLVEDRKQGRVGATTVVFNRHGNALYFSKEVVPFLPDRDQLAVTPVYHHVGIYAYRYDTLQAYPHWPIGPLEASEQLEQLRFLENGKRVRVVEVDSKGQQFWELNNPEDVAILEKMITENARVC